MDVREVQRVLEAEQASLDEVVSGLDDSMWALSTASPRWSVADQIGHLTYFDQSAALAITDPDAFSAGVGELLAELTSDEEANDEVTLARYRSMAPAELVAQWRAGREELSNAASTLENETRVVWYGPSMGSKSFLTARLMECWAHGQDVVDATGGHREATDRIRHIAQLGAITRGWTYKNRGLAVPEGEVRVELRAPSGTTWSFGPDDAADSVVGSAVEFCLVVTQRRNIHDTVLATTPLTLDWLEKAQAFAGPPTDPPAPA